MKEKIQRINELLLSISVKGNDVALMYEAQMILKDIYAEAIKSEAEK